MALGGDGKRVIDGASTSAVAVETPAPSSPWGPEHEIDWQFTGREAVWVPPAFRVPTVSEASARRMLRCTRTCFERLIEAGLPYDDSPAGRLFDEHDIKNAGMLSRSGVTEVELGMRLMLAFMRSSREQLTSPRRWRYRLQLVSDAPAGARMLRRVHRPMPELWGGELESATSATGQPVESTDPFFKVAQGSEVTGTFITRGAELTLRSTAVRRIFDDLLDGVRWHYLPAAFTTDPTRVLAAGAGNCATLCAVLEQRLRDAGFEAHGYQGWMLALAEMSHGWVEVVDDDGDLKYLDPSFALLGDESRFGTTGFRDFVTGSVLNRVVPTRSPVDHPFYEGDNRLDTVSFLSRPEQLPVPEPPGRRWKRRS